MVLACVVTIGVVCAVLILGQAAVDKLLARAAGLIPGKELQPYRQYALGTVERTVEPGEDEEPLS